MLLLIDNYDSFTYNLAQYFGELGCELIVRRNDAISLREISALAPERICISPGPCTPREAGISKDIILFGRLKKETVTAAVEFLESGNRRFSIRDELGENRDHVAPFCELDEFAQSGSDVRHCGHTSVKNRARIFLPSRVSTDSGWNCTPCTGNSR